MSPTHGWLCGVVVMTSDWESVGSDFKYRNFNFWERKAYSNQSNLKYKIRKTQLCAEEQNRHK